MLDTRVVGCQIVNANSDGFFFGMYTFASFDCLRFGSQQFIVFWWSLVIILAVTNNGCQTLANKKLGNVSILSREEDEHFGTWEIVLSIWKVFLFEYFWCIVSTLIHYRIKPSEPNYNEAFFSITLIQNLKFFTCSQICQISDVKNVWINKWKFVTYCPPTVTV